jgi:hypothetical protein
MALWCVLRALSLGASDWDDELGSSSDPHCTLLPLLVLSPLETPGGCHYGNARRPIAFFSPVVIMCPREPLGPWAMGGTEAHAQKGHAQKR